MFFSCSVVGNPLRMWYNQLSIENCNRKELNDMKWTMRWIAVFVAVCLLALPFAALADTLKRGSSGEDVEQIQEWLTDLGYLNDVVDGKFGKKTEAAVKAFQKTIGVKQDGKLTDEQQEQLMFLYYDVTGAMEGDGLDPEELKEIYPAGCSRTGDEAGEVDYCWRHQEAGYLTALMLKPNLPDKAIAEVAERAVDIWLENIYALYDEWAEIDPETAYDQLDVFEEAWAEVEPDLNDVYGVGSAAALKAMAFWLEGVCTDRCFDLFTAEGNGD
ncbi:MAG: peptidoglycan-binding protein [Clostridia bacterium]|nr:peptidoglycan-binding protein [Clostridia bacterium]